MEPRIVARIFPATTQFYELKEVCMECPTIDKLNNYLFNNLELTQHLLITSHLKECEKCNNKFQTLRETAESVFNIDKLEMWEDA